MNNPVVNNIQQTSAANPMQLILNMMGGGQSTNMLMNMAMGMLQKQNPQAFQQVQQLINANANPLQLINQELSNYSPEQTQQFKNMALSYGVPRNIVNQLG